MFSGIHYQRLEFRDVEAEQFKEVIDRANLEHTIIGGRRGRAEIEQFHGTAFSVDRTYIVPNEMTLDRMLGGVASRCTWGSELRTREGSMLRSGMRAMFDPTGRRRGAYEEDEVLVWTANADLVAYKAV